MEIFEPIISNFQIKYWLNHHSPQYRVGNLSVFCSFFTSENSCVFYTSSTPTSVSHYITVLYKSCHAYFCCCIEILCIIMWGCYGDYVWFVMRKIYCVWENSAQQWPLNLSSPPPWWLGESTCQDVHSYKPNRFCKQEVFTAQKTRVFPLLGRWTWTSAGWYWCTYFEECIRGIFKVSIKFLRWKYLQSMLMVSHEGMV